MLEGDRIVASTSPFTNKQGRLVVGENITLIDDPTIEGAWGSYNYNDEGIKSNKNSAFIPSTYRR